MVDQYHIPTENIYLITLANPSDILQRLANSGVQGSMINVAQTTPENARNVLRQIVQRCRDFAQRTFLFFHYSGHGGIIRVDPRTGAIQTGLQVGNNVFLTNDELYQLLVLRLPRRTRLFALIDACNSGSALALPCVYNLETEQWTRSISAPGDEKLPECEVTSIGASTETQVSNQVHGPIIGYGGALTVAFLESGTAVDSINEPTKVVQILAPKFSKMNQIPQLESGQPL